MEYARRYEALARSRKERFRNDHIAFRTIAWGPHGIHSVSRLFEALGYVVSGCYEFPDKKLSSLHYQHADRRLPKLFISQLKSWELSAASRRILARSLKTHRPALRDGVPTLSRTLRHFHSLPWNLPQRRDVEALNEESQFAAWVLLNGYNVNHFTAAVKDIETAVAALRAAGVPMKAEIEGSPGSRLRQSSTEAVVLPAKVRQGEKVVTMPWTYAYFELAERPVFKDPDTGRTTRFEGFFGSQAANLFEMTKVV
jgi:hypothetical protein